MGKLTAAVCSCGKVLIPPKIRCIYCSVPTKSLEINNTGKIITYTVLHATPDGFEAPLILGLIELELNNDQNKLNLSNPKLICIGKVPEAKLNIGQTVIVEKTDNKYYFKLAKDNNNS